MNLMPEILVYFIATPGLRQQVCHLQTPICHKPELKLGFLIWTKLWELSDMQNYTYQY